jgi:glutathione S-transferase
MRLHQSIHAPNARRVRIFLAEKVIEIALVNHDLAKLDHRDPAFAALNPFETVPVLEFDDGGTLSESIAICRYLEALSPEPALFGRGARDIAEIEMWQRRAELHLFYPIAQAFRHSHPAMKTLESPQVPDWAAACKGKAHWAFERFDRSLEGRPYLAGDAFTVADITGLVAMDMTRLARIEVPAEFHHLARWRASISARPSAKA